MNNPLELAGTVRRLDRPASGRVLIVGARRDSRRLARCLSRGPWSDLPVVGFIDAGHPRYSGGIGRGRQLAVHPQSAPVPVLGGIDDLDALVDRARATHLIVAVQGGPARRIRPRIASLSNSEVAVHWVTDEVSRDDFPTLAPSGPSSRVPLPLPLAWDRFGKRLVDLVAAAIGLLLLMPLFAVAAVLILATSGRPILYRQERVGQGGRIFKIFKFRSMRRDAEGTTGPIWASNQDARCTRIGAWLRRTNIDELPQLWNVLVGDMSLVGPRPERPVFVEEFRDSIPDYDLRHAVPSGMTGWAQVHGWRGRTSLRKRIQYDLDYIQRWSFGLDFLILFMTVQHIVWGKTSWKGPTTKATAAKREAS